MAVSRGTGVFRPDSAERAAQVAAQRRQAGVVNVPTSSVAGGRLMPATPARPATGPAWRVGGINEIGSGGYAIGGFPKGDIGSEAEAAYNAATRPTTSVTGPLGGGGGGTGGAGGTGSAGSGGGMGGGFDRGRGSSMPQPGTSAWDELMAALDKYAAEAGTQIRGAGESLRSALTSRDPEAAFQWNPANVNIPEATLANYVQATGGSPAEVAATRQLSQDLLNAFLGDVGQVAQGSQTASQNWRQRQVDVASQLEADALRQLALNQLGARFGISQAKTQEQRNLENDALALALKFAEAQRRGSNLSLTQPALPFQTVTLPDGSIVTIPNQ
jgi:hypothetical protein